MSKKESAIKWLENCLPMELLKDDYVLKILKEAKKLEKQQIIDAVINTSSLGENSANVFANDYFNETFKK